MSNRPSNEIAKKIQHERIRLKEVRSGLSAALVPGAQGAENYVPYYIAVADYIEASMKRLDVQDVRMGEMLRERIESGNPEAEDALTELDRRLSGNQKLLVPFLAARDGLKEKGATALGAYEDAARAYTDYITANMGHHGASTALARQEFSEKDWAYMAHISEEDMAREVQLFDAVEAAKP